MTIDKNNDRDPEGFFALADKYLETLLQKNYSKQTYICRKNHLYRFARWCFDYDVSTPRSVTKDLILKYKLYLKNYTQKNGKPLSTNTRNGYLVIVSNYFEYLAKHNHIMFNPAGEIQLFKKEQKIPKNVLTREEVEQVINSIDTSDFKGIRNRAIVETLYSTGIRASELIHLETDDISLSQGTLLVREGKGKKDRLIPIGERACQWVQKYLYEVRPSLASNKTKKIFLTLYNKAFALKGFSRMISIIVRNSGIGKKGACHLFRHSMSTHMLENGADIAYIQQILGHAEITTTEIYTKISISKLKAIHTFTHPACIEEMELAHEQQNH